MILQHIDELLSSNNRPPITPPKKAPKNWLLAFTPIAVALDWIGAALDSQEGNKASITLKAIKNRPRPMSKIYLDSKPKTITIKPRIIPLIATRKIARILWYFSARIILGKAKNRLSTNRGK